MSHITDDHLFEYLTMLELMRDGVEPGSALAAGFADVSGHIPECPACEDRLYDLMASIASIHAAVRSLQPCAAAAASGPRGLLPVTITRNGASLSFTTGREGHCPAKPLDDDPVQVIPHDHDEPANPSCIRVEPTMGAGSDASFGRGVSPRSGRRGKYIVSALLLAGLGGLTWGLLPPAARRVESAGITAPADSTTSRIADTRGDVAVTTPLTPVAHDIESSRVETGIVDPLASAGRAPIAPSPNPDDQTNAAPYASETCFSGPKRQFFGSLFFATGSDRLTPESRKLVAEFARKVTLTSIPTVTVEGYSSPEPIRKSPFRDNWQLSQARADAVKQELVARGVAEDRIEANGMGAHRGSGSVARSMRADLFLTGERGRDGRDAADATVANQMQ